MDDREVLAFSQHDDCSQSEPSDGSRPTGASYDMRHIKNNVRLELVVFARLLVSFA